ncbi:MAG: serine/threonine protein kinase [Victivallaceae bacterium]|nr:serine/threonine protein kinase [Victivallaceae bacterium]
MHFECPVCKKLISIQSVKLGTGKTQCTNCNKTVSIPTSKLSSGAVLADFIMREEVGQGGMGIVYRSDQISFARPAAVKILSEKHSTKFSSIADFLREARQAALLNHPNIVQAYAVGNVGDIYYFAMEYVDGETTKERLDSDGVIPIEEAICVIREVASALDYTWEVFQMVHCDIKPDNIMINSLGETKLMDLGLAVHADYSFDPDNDEVLGTVQYISPEQLTGKPLDIRSDIYSLGATFYHYITGKIPFDGETKREMGAKRLKNDPVPPHKVNRNIPIEVSDIVMKMLKRQPIERYQNGEELIEDLKPYKVRKRIYSNRNVSERSTTLPKITSTTTSIVPLSDTGKLIGKITSKNNMLITMALLGGLIVTVLIIVLIFLVLK